MAGPLIRKLIITFYTSGSASTIVFKLIKCPVRIKTRTPHLLRRIHHHIENGNGTQDRRADYKLSALEIKPEKRK